MNDDCSVLPAALDSTSHWQAARRLRQEHPQWVVIWLANLSCYRAYPLFRAARETALSAATPEQLADEMDRFPRPPRGSQVRSRNQV